MAGPLPAIVLVTDRKQIDPAIDTRAAELAALDALIDEAIDAGVDIVQIRERDLDAGELVALARRAAQRARATRTRVLVNDRLDAAAVAPIAGVHVRSDGPPVARVRAWKADWIIGRSVHAAEDVEHIQPGDSPDYFLFGTVFESASKPHGAPIGGVDGLRRVVAAARAPVFAIGGITPANAATVVAAGAMGVAAIGPFLPRGRRPDAIGAAAAVRAFRRALGGV